MKTVLITGAQGYVGSQLIRELSKTDYRLITLLHKSPKGDFKYPHINNYDFENLDAFIDQYRPDVIINLAANISKGISPTEIDDIITSNIIMPSRLITVANKFKIKSFINISTYSTSSDSKIYAPQTFYAASKMACENILDYFHQSEFTKVINLIFYDIYGPNQGHDRFLNQLFDAIMNSKEFRMSAGEQEFSPLHVSDAVQAIIHSVERFDEILNVGENKYCVFGPEIFILRELPLILAHILNKPLPKIYFDRPYRKNEIMKFLPRHKLLPGWRPAMTFEMGINTIINTL